MKISKPAIAIALVSLLISTFSHSSEIEIGELTIMNPWTRATPQNAKTGAGYLFIRNNGNETDYLIGGSSSAAKSVEIHETSLQEGVMKMRHMENGLPVPPGKTVELNPGGYHIMFMGLTDPFPVGNVIPVILHFQQAGEVEIDLEVMKMGKRTLPMELSQEQKK